jgi:seryl-tRNA synthetase
LFKSGQTAEVESKKLRTAELKKYLKGWTFNFKTVEEEVKALLYQVPNTPHESVVFGKGADDNVEVFAHGTRPTFLISKPNRIGTLCSQFDLIDFELGNKITGAGFPVYRNKGASIQRALINFFLDEARNAGYEEFMLPLLVNEDSGIGTGQLPDKEDQMYHAQIDNLYLIPTAEVPLTNIFRDVILKEEQLPLKLTGYTPCFRREAGSYGKDVRGLNRLHQFDKVEIVQIAHPADSYRILEEMVDHVKMLLQKLGLEFRILRLCGGDMGFASACTYDFEVYSAAQQRWLEVSSTSNFETFQANRLKCRFKGKDGKTQLVHTFNGSALALPRIVASIFENYQDEKGISIPEVLRPYCGFDRID